MNIDNYMINEHEPEKVYRCESCGAILDADEVAGGLDNCYKCETEVEEDIHES